MAELTLRNCWISLALLALVSPGSSLAQLGGRQFDEPEWSEQEVALPPFPARENLIVVRLSDAMKFDVLIDKGSIDIGADGVVRYAIVARSPGGATNVSFEGIRCSTRERKLYAIGTSRNTWTRLEASKWQGIRGGGASAFHESLALYYLCAERFPLSPVSRILERLGRH
jgi:hypothetical protein